MQVNDYYQIEIITWNFIKVILMTNVKGDPKVPFSIATTSRCRGRHYTFSLDFSALILISNRAISQMSREFANGPRDWGSIPGQVIPKTQKMVFDAALLNTQHYKVRIKGEVEQSREWSSTPLYLGVVAIEKGAFRSPTTKVANLNLYNHLY